MKNSISVTGHRSDKLHAWPNSTLIAYASKRLIELNPKEVRTGMALGWDLIVAEACRRLRIPFVAYVPCNDQASKWLWADRENYTFLMSKAKAVVKCFDGPCDDGAFELRNRKMIGGSDLLAGFWNGSPGGTQNAFRYAVQVGVETTNWYNEFIEIMKEKKG